MDVESIISSPASLELIRCYSKLYSNGNPCPSCAAAQRGYYEALKQDGIEKANLYNKVMTRTCKPKFKGIVQISKYGMVNAETMTDEVALYLLNNKLLTESYFEKLPEGYKVEKEIEPVNEVVETTKVAETAQPKQRRSRTKKQ